MKALFPKAASVRSVLKGTTTNPFAFVTFETEEEANAALNVSRLNLVLISFLTISLFSELYHISHLHNQLCYFLLFLHSLRLKVLLLSPSRIVNNNKLKQLRIALKPKSMLLPSTLLVITHRLIPSNVLLMLVQR